MKPQSHIFNRMRAILHYVCLLLECERDARTYFRFSTVSGYTPGHEAIQRQSELMRLTHSIEKSLCMPDFRPRSAAATVKALVSILSIPGLRVASGTDTIATADAVIDAYRCKHECLGVDVTDILRGWNPSHPVTAHGGVNPWKPAVPTDADAFQRFFRSRRSLRHFDPEKVPSSDIIERAVDLAIHAPSVCNRQTWRVHVYTGSKVAKILALQNGNRGFGHTIPLLLVVTSDLRFFTGIEERYQPWIEGGIFTMALLLALHAEGLGTVTLNWSLRHRTDSDMKVAAKLPGHERISALIGCGLPGKYPNSPISHRNNSSIITIH